MKTDSSPIDEKARQGVGRGDTPSYKSHRGLLPLTTPFAPTKNPNQKKKKNYQQL